MKIHWFGKYSALSCAKFLIFAKKWVGKVYVWYGGCHVYSQHFPLPVMRWSYSHFSLLLVSRDTGTWQHWASSVTVNYGVKVSIKSWIISVILVNDHCRGKWFIHGNILCDKLCISSIMHEMLSIFKKKRLFYLIYIQKFNTFKLFSVNIFQYTLLTVLWSTGVTILKAEFTP